MSRKIKHDQYEVIVNFKTDNIMSMNVEFSLTNEHFANNSIELMRINKETVFASLQKKSERNLRCEFQQTIQEGKKVLVITFIVNFDFLPEFREEVRLDFVQFKESIKKFNFANIRAEIDELQRAISNIEAYGSTTLHEANSIMVNSQKKQIWTSEVKKGKYIIRISGTMTNAQAQNYPDLLKIFIKPPGNGQTKQIIWRAHYQPSYQYPFFFSETVDCEQGSLQIIANSTIPNCYLYNVSFIKNRITEVN